MNIAPKTSFILSHRHLLGIEGLSPEDINGLLDLAEEYVQLNRQVEKKRTALRGRTLINLFFEVSTRTQSSFELAGKRLGADVMNMAVGNSSLKKGETLIDTAMTLNAMRPDLLVVRHPSSGAVELLARKVDGSVINAGDGADPRPHDAEQMDVGAGDPAVQDVAADRHQQSFEPAAPAADGQGIEQRLGRVLVRAVPGVDHRAVDLLREQLDRAGRVVTHHQDVRTHGIKRDRGIDQGLALAHRGRAGRHVHDVGAEPLAGKLE